MSITGLPGNIPHQGLKERNPPELHISKVRSPTPSDSGSQFNIGDMWIDVKGNNAYILVSKAQGVAVWVLAAASTGDVNFLKGDSGGDVGPDGGGVIDILGGTGITTVGNPGTNSITVSSSGTVATQYDEDAGTAIPAAGILKIVGGTGINTSGAGNTVTINATGGVGETFPVDNGGPGVPLAGAMSILGSTSADFPVKSGLETHVGGTANEMYLENRRFVSSIIVDPSAVIGARGEFTTISAAITAVTSGQTIYVRPGTYTEDLTLVGGITIIGLTGGSSVLAVRVRGKIIADQNGKVQINNITFDPANGEVIESTSGSSEVNFNNCTLIAADDILCSSGNTNFRLFFVECELQNAGNSDLFDVTAGLYELTECTAIRSGAFVIKVGGTAAFEVINSNTINFGFESLGTAQISVTHSTVGVTAASVFNINSAGSSIGAFHCILEAGAGPNFAIGTGTFLYGNLLIEPGTPEGIAGTLTTTILDWKPYATAALTEPTVEKGTCGFDSNDFTVTDGFVQTKASGLFGSAQTVGAVTADVITFPLGAIAGTYTFEVDVAAFESGTPLGAGYNMSGCVRTTGAAGTVVGVPDKNVFEEGALSAGDANIIASGNNMIVRVLGTAALTVEWEALAVRVFAK